MQGHGAARDENMSVREVSKASKKGRKESVWAKSGQLEKLPALLQRKEIGS